MWHRPHLASLAEKREEDPPTDDWLAPAARVFISPRLRPDEARLDAIRQRVAARDFFCA
jgi:hypothetical protein